MAASPDEENDPMSNRYIPREARAVPHELFVQLNSEKSHTR